MWNSSRKTNTNDANAPKATATSQPQATPPPIQPPTPVATAAPEPKGIATIGKSVCLKGQVKASEDLVIDGQVDGTIDLPDHTLTVGPNAQVMANIVAKVVIVFGTVVGSVTASDKVEIRKSGSVEGDLRTGRMSIQDGGHYRGRVETSYRRVTTDAKGASAVEQVAV